MDLILIAALTLAAFLAGAWYAWDTAYDKGRADQTVQDRIAGLR